MGYLKIAITEKVLVKKFCSFLFWIPEIPKNSWVKVIGLENWPDPDNPSRGVCKVKILVRSKRFWANSKLLAHCSAEGNDAADLSQRRRNHLPNFPIDGRVQGFLQQVYCSRMHAGHLWILSSHFHTLTFYLSHSGSEPYVSYDQTYIIHKYTMFVLPCQSAQMFLSESSSFDSLYSTSPMHYLCI